MGKTYLRGNNNDNHTKKRPVLISSVTTNAVLVYNELTENISILFLAIIFNININNKLFIINVVEFIILYVVFVFLFRRVTIVDNKIITNILIYTYIDGK